jgi:hypothetical protein
MQQKRRNPTGLAKFCDQAGRCCKFVIMTDESTTKANPLQPVLINYGGAEKLIADMNEEELEEARQSIMRRAREKAFSKGLPIYYYKEGVQVAEYPDGRIVTVTKK